LKFKSASGLADGAEIKDVKIDKGYQAVLKTSYGILDNLDVYVKLGVADYTLEEDEYRSGTKYLTSENDTDIRPVYGIGLKGVYHLNESSGYSGYRFQSNWLNDWIIGCDLQYLRSEHKTKTTTTTGLSTKYKKVVIQEWHIAPYIAKQFNNFIPYLGIRYSDMRVSQKEPEDTADWTDNNKYEADKNFGIFLGTDYIAGENLNLNFEGRFLDETAGSFAVNWKI
ncbi:MAG: hypothetical protein AB7E08_03150, partial [Candidatus Omnitrophota bacterium]